MRQNVADWSLDCGVLHPSPVLAWDAQFAIDNCWIKQQGALSWAEAAKVVTKCRGLCQLYDRAEIFLQEMHCSSGRGACL